MQKCINLSEEKVLASSVVDPASYRNLLTTITYFLFLLKLEDEILNL